MELLKTQGCVLYPVALVQTSVAVVDSDRQLSYVGTVRRKISTQARGC